MQAAMKTRRGVARDVEQRGGGAETDYYSGASVELFAKPSVGPIASMTVNHH